MRSSESANSARMAISVRMRCLLGSRNMDATATSQNTVSPSPERAAEPGEASSNREGHSKDRIHVDAEPARHARVIDRGTQARAEARLGERKLQRNGQKPADRDDQQTIAADADPEKINLALEI